MNPVLPEKSFVPDAEARVMPDGRLYIYGSWDLSGSAGYCSKELHCFSTDDMEHWEDHGVIFSNTAACPGVPWHPDSVLYAPDAIYKDGKYYLYLCGPDENRGFEGVAAADSPIGPFAPAEKIKLANGDGIDPTIFVDDDGAAYYYWGQGTLRGGRLLDDMKTLVPDTVKRDILTEWEHGFHEGASIRKREGRYYMVYTDVSRGRATCLSYAMADHPLGPYKKCGVIVDNTGCDPESWNDHGSIACYKDRWYVFYHRSSQKSRTSRRVCVEPIFFDENGYIKEVEMTSQGASAPLNAFAPIRASRACRMMGSSFIAPCGEGEMLTNCGKDVFFGNPGWAEYKYIDFEDGAAVAAVRVRGKGTVTLCVENNTALGRAEFDTAGFEEIRFPVQPVKGVHTLWLLLQGGPFDVESITFKK